MSRSIHMTRRMAEEIRRADYADPEEKQRRLENSRRLLRRKRKIKSSMNEERRAYPPPLADGSPAVLPVEVLDEGPHVFHAATPEDIRAVLDRLPSSAGEGISRVQLSLGSEDQLESHEPDGYEEFDPYTGRLSLELFPGVYCGDDILGTYCPRSGLVSLYAYVCDWSQCPLPQEIGELLLKLRALNTLAHEAAHHHDWTARVSRGRWFPGSKTRREEYARRMENAWTAQIVVPYLKEAYPAQVEALLGLLRERIGLVCDWETLTQANLSGRWLCEFLAEPSRLESQLSLAWDTHFADEYEFCLLIIQQILAENPDHLETQILHADTLQHLKRYDEGLTVINQVLENHPSHDDAHYTKILILSGAKEWEKVLQLCEQWEKMGDFTDEEHEHSLHWFRGMAHGALQQTELLEKDILALEALRLRREKGTPIDQIRPQFFRALKRWMGGD